MTHQVRAHTHVACCRWHKDGGEPPSGQRHPVRWTTQIVCCIWHKLGGEPPSKQAAALTTNHPRPV